MLGAVSCAAKFAGCTRVGSAATNLILRLRSLEPDREGAEGEALGLRLAEDVLVSIARADPPPRVVEQVLELWLLEAASSLDACPARSVFDERPALKRAVFDADMRNSVRNAPLLALRAFRMAVGIMLERVRSAPSCVAAVDAQALMACQAAERMAEEAHALAADFVAATAPGAAADGARYAQAAAGQASAEAEDAFIVAGKRVAAALAARGAWAGSAVSEDDESDAESDYEPLGVGSGAAHTDAEAGEFDMSAESKQELDGLDRELERLADLPVTSLADGRTTCARLPGSRVDAPEALVKLGVPVGKGMLLRQTQDYLPLHAHKIIMWGSTSTASLCANAAGFQTANWAISAHGADSFGCACPPIPSFVSSHYHYL